MPISIAAWLPASVSIVLVIVAGWMMSLRDDLPDDKDDVFTPLLYNCPEMRLADQAILDDEPWETGGLDY